ncbi:hypothetical protein DXG01_010832 [Tephrocybe rancida]|nr:hypothetical protein DXG01_010832 [Tephrocybe rancida]
MSTFLKLTILDFPLELYPAIFEYLDNNDLISLATVSSQFQLEAELLLYRNVDLSNSSISGQRVLSWCTTVSTVERKALRVHFLKFPSSIRGIPYHFDTELLVDSAFLALANLKHLLLMGGSKDDLVSIHPATLIKCSFKLESFLGDTPNFDVENTLQFLATQPTIEYWVPTHPFLQACVDFPSTTLPLLRRLVFVNPAKLHLLSGRPVDSLVLLSLEPQFTRGLGMDICARLKPFSRTLHTLVYTHPSLLEDWSAPAMIRALAESAPGLKSLTLSSFSGTNSKTSTQAHKEFLDAVANLRLIETLVLSTDMEALYEPNNEALDNLNPLEHTEAWERRSLNPVQCRKVATGFMEACRHLHQLSFPFRHDKDFKTMTYLRTTDGSNVAKFDGFRTIDTSGWWMK